MRKQVFKTIFLAAVMIISTVFIPCEVLAATEPATEVYVTISEDKGNLALVQEKISVKDTDEDGVLTIQDALYCAHEAAYVGGAKEGYGTESTEYGLSLVKLWGIENGGSYGYLINNQNAMSLSDSIQSGDYINAYAYQDLTAWSDQYVYFDQWSLEAKADDTVTLKLSGIGYDENWSPVVLPIEDADIYINGSKTEFITDEDGNVTLNLPEGNKWVITAQKEGVVLVPNACVINDSTKAQDTKDSKNTNTWLYVIIAAAAILIVGMIVFILIRNGHKNEGKSK